jgi:hypothetical protein
MSKVVTSGPKVITNDTKVPPNDPFGITSGSKVITNDAEVPPFDPFGIPAGPFVVTPGAFCGPGPPHGSIIPRSSPRRQVNRAPAFTLPGRELTKGGRNFRKRPGAGKCRLCRAP